MPQPKPEPPPVPPKRIRKLDIADNTKPRPVKKGTTRPGSAHLHKKWIRSAKASVQKSSKNSALVAYNKQYRGITSAKEEPLKGKPTPLHGDSLLYTNLWDTVISPQDPAPSWKATLQTRASLQRRGRFGRSDRNHSVTQEAAFETCIVPIIVSGYLGYYEFSALCNTHKLIPHIVKMLIKCHNYNFTWIAYEDPY